jgi:cytochrome c oxidase subunit 2
MTLCHPVFNGKMRERIFTKQKFTDEFEAVGGLFYGQCAEYCGNSHAYMSFRALAQTDKDFDAWVNKFQTAQNPNLQPSAYNPVNEYSKGSLVTFSDKSLGDSATREFRAIKEVAKGEAPNLSKKIWTQANPDDYELGKQLFSSLQCVQCHAINRTGLGSKGS